MFSSYERKIFWTCAARLLKLYADTSSVNRQFLEQLEVSLIADADRSEWTARMKSQAAEGKEPPSGGSIDPSQPPLSELALAQVRRVRGARPSALRRKIELLRALIRLDPVDVELVEFLLLYQKLPCIVDLYRLLSNRFGSDARVLGLLLGRGGMQIEQRLAPSSRLIRSGLLVENRYPDNDPPVRVRQSVCMALLRPMKSGDELRRALLGPPRSGGIDWSDFIHLERDAEIAMSLLRGALQQRATGVNILIHGPPGTGKTVFGATLAKRLGIDLYDVAIESGAGGLYTPMERAAEARLGQRLLESSRNAALLFDEAGSVLSLDGTASIATFGSASHGNDEARAKAYLNDMLETNPVPTLWTCNNIGNVDPAILRRFSTVLEFGLPPRPVRRRIWSSALAAIDPAIAAEAAARLSRYPVSPGVITQAVRTARLGGGGEAVVERSVQLLGNAVSGIRMPPMPVGEDFFDTDLINCEADLRSVVRTLAKNCGGRASICVHGPPGTGKSRWVRHLAEQLGMEVLQRRASDLLSAWVGSTEKNIARSFAEAIDQRAFLVFDEVDSLLRDRRQAAHGWQISEVNEMLTWMECHPLPFACTTNLPETLDRAALRRFDLKLKFDYLRAEQARSAFRRFFGMAPPASRSLPGPLTPADFGVVARRSALAGALDANGLIELLNEECRHRAPAKKAIGFIHAEGA